MNDTERLFESYDWFSVKEKSIDNIKNDINSYNNNQLLNTPTEDLCQYFIEKHQYEVPCLKKENLFAEQKETQVDISNDHNRYVLDRSRPTYINGTKVSVTLPFEGNAFLFHVRPTTSSSMSPRAIINENYLILNYVGIDLKSNIVRNSFDSRIKDIEEYLTWLRKDVDDYHKQIPSLIENEVKRRKEKLLNDQNILSELGFPLKERSDSNKTYAAPQVKRKINLHKPAGSIEPYTPEPALSIENYDYILKILNDMALVMERSPSAFVTMKEEDIRMHFLVQLNGHFEGAATGETFNYSGKTDILIRVNGKNIFIGECKFWTGPKKLHETIDQLLGYISWRDTKTAIILFNKNKNFSNVLQSIPDVIESHPNYKKGLIKSSETNFKYIFSQKNDPSREMFLTVMAFDIPIHVQ